MKFNCKLRFIMLKISLVFLLSLICHGCASSSSSNRFVAPTLSKSTPTKVDNRLIKYATTQGCQMMKNGYMVCPKSMNR
jgi:hypothetical protein